MGIMHREVITRRRDTTIIASIIFLSLMIALARIIGELRINRFKIELISDPIFIAITLFILYIETIKCKTSYKYSVIANQLMIHKVKTRNQEILENIKIDNIVFFGRDKENKNKYKINNKKRYICNLFNCNTYCCIYKRNEGYGKFYFQPSRELIKKLKRVI